MVYASDEVAIEPINEYTEASDMWETIQELEDPWLFLFIEGNSLLVCGSWDADPFNLILPLDMQESLLFLPLIIRNFLLVDLLPINILYLITKW